MQEMDQHLYANMRLYTKMCLTTREYGILHNIILLFVFLHHAPVSGAPLTASILPPILVLMLTVLTMDSNVV